MENQTTRLTIRIRRDANGLAVGIPGLPSDDTLEPTTSHVSTWAGVEQVGAQIREAISEINLRRGAEDAERRLADAGGRLFQTAFPSDIREQIRSSGCHYLVLDLDATTLDIPWELAHDGSDFLGCRFSFGRMVREWVPQSPLQSRPRSADKRVLLVVSNPSGDLRAASREGEFVSNLLSDEMGQQVVWLNDRVEAQTLGQWFPRSDLLHFSGHFSSVSTDPMPSGWEMVDGRFAFDNNQTATAGTQHIPLLIFNNACQAADAHPANWAQQDGIFAQSLIKRGCIHYIGACSKLIDQYGAEFAKIFYRHLLLGGAVGTALQRARLEIRSKHECDHLTWAQYVLYGDPARGFLGERALSPEVHTVVTTDASLHSDVIEGLLSAFPRSEWIHNEEGRISLLFPRPSEGVRFAVLFLFRIRETRSTEDNLQVPRLAVANGEILVEREEDTGRALVIRGFPCETATALLTLAEPGQILTNRSVHDNARALLGGREACVNGQLVWLDHGHYIFQAFEHPMEVCEVGDDSGLSPLHPPRDVEFARRSISPDQEAILGWRPAIGNEIPTSPEWVLTEKLGAGGFGEVWRAARRSDGAKRVFKFCFRADRVRSLKREATLFRIMKDRLGPHSNIVRIYDVFFERPPFYLSMEDVHGLDLAKWCESNSSDPRFSEAIRLEILAKVADALHAAHDAGVIHRDIKPSNILVLGSLEDPESINIKLSDFGIGQVDSDQIVSGLIGLGFTETLSRTELTSGSGSRIYMAPELLIGKESSIRSDIYSLGIVLYQILLGDCNRPLTVDWARDIEDPILLEDLRGCLSGKASERFSSAQELAIRLRSVPERRVSRIRNQLRSQIDHRRKRLLRGATLVAALAIGLSAMLGYGLRKASIERENLEHILYHLNMEEARRSIEDDPTHSRSLLLAAPDRFRGWEWGQIAAAANVDNRAFSQSSPITTLDLSGDNKFLGTGDTDGKLKVWDFLTGVEAWEIHPTTHTIQAISIDCDSTNIATSDGYQIDIFAIGTAKKVATFRSEHRLQGGIRFAPHSKQLAAANSEGQLLIYDLLLGTTTAIDSGHQGGIHDFDFLPDGQSIMTAGNDSVCQIVDILKREVVGRIADSNGRPFKALTISLDGRCFAITSENRILHGLLSPFEFAESVPNISAPGRDICFHPSGELLAVAQANHRIEVFHPRRIQTGWMRGGAQGNPRSIAFTQDGRFLLTVDEDGKVRQRTIGEGTDGEMQLSGHEGWIHSLEFSPDGSLLATGSEDMTVSLWDPKTGTEQRRFEAGSRVDSLAWSPEGALLAAGADSGKVFLWDTSSGVTLHEITAHAGKVRAIDFHPEGESFASKGSDGEIVLWSTKGDQPLMRIASEPDEVLSYSPDGTTIYSTQAEFDICEWHLKNGNPVRTLKGHRRPIRTLAFSLDGTEVASGDEDGEVILWDVATGRINATFKSRVTNTHELMFTPDGKRLLTSVEIWDRTNLRAIIPLPVDAKAISPDGRYLAIGGNWRRLRLVAAFPSDAMELSEGKGLSLEERMEACKRRFWLEHPGFAKHWLPAGTPSQTDEPGVVGSWDFDQGNLNATVGRNLEFFGTETKQSTSFGSTQEFGIPPMNNQTAFVVRLVGHSRTMGIQLYSNATPLVGDAMQAYTILFDIFYPEESAGVMRPLFNTDSSNSSPAELIISPTGGIGIEGVFHGSIQTGTWHRIACSVNLAGVPRIDKFIDGQPVGTQVLTGHDRNRWAIEEGTRGRSILLFAGRDGGVAPCFVNSIQFRDYAMSPEEIAELGPPSAEGIPIGEKN